MELLRPDELQRIEKEFEGGMTAKAILEVFRPRGARLSEGTFRKYVQSGLLPRSRRVGRKGKHRGSQGLYPVEAVRRINAIKKMMAEGLTLDEIRRSFVFFKNNIEQVDRDIVEVLDGFGGMLAESTLPKERKRELKSQLDDLREKAGELVRDVTKLGSLVTARTSQMREATQFNAGIAAGVHERRGA